MCLRLNFQGFVWGSMLTWQNTTTYTISDSTRTHKHTQTQSLNFLLSHPGHDESMGDRKHWRSLNESVFCFCIVCVCVKLNAAHVFSICVIRAGNLIISVLINDTVLHRDWWELVVPQEAVVGERTVIFNEEPGLCLFLCVCVCVCVWTTSPVPVH